MLVGPKYIILHISIFLQQQKFYDNKSLIGFMTEKELTIIIKTTTQRNKELRTTKKSISKGK